MQNGNQTTKLLLAAAETQNFRKAAELCVVAQSALSRQIMALEEELGIMLFRRVKQRVTLTEAGKEFSAFARNALDQLQRGQHAMTELETGERGVINLGCIEALAVSFLPLLFARFHQKHPNIRLRVNTAGADQLFDFLREGELDLVLSLDPPMHSNLLVTYELFRQPILLVTAPDHPLAISSALTGAVTLEELHHYPVVHFAEGYGLRRIIDRIYTRNGWMLLPLVEIDNIEGLKELVKQKVGISLMPASLLRPEQVGRELVVRRIAELDEEYSFALVYRRVGIISKAARALIDEIQTYSQVEPYQVG